MNKLLRPAIVLPLLVSAALVAALLTIGNVTTIAGLLQGFRRGEVLGIVLLLIGYEAVQCTQWHVLLRALRVPVTLRVQAFTYLVGQPTRVLPIGNFVENVLLRRIAGIDVGLSSAATLLSVFVEVGVALVGLALLGVGPWGWLRPLIIVGLSVCGLAVWGVSRLHNRGHIPVRLRRYRGVRIVLAEARQFRDGAAALLHPAVLARAVLLGGLYLLLGGSTLYLVILGLGGTLSWDQALVVYFFSLACALILPSPVDIGVTETGGVAALLALGIGKGVAVSAMLVLRGMSFGVALLVALLTLLALRRETWAMVTYPPHTLSSHALQDRPATGLLEAAPAQRGHVTQPSDRPVSRTLSGQAGLGADASGECHGR